MSARPFEYLHECSHWWRDSGKPFKTYARADRGPDNPLRQAQICKHCGAVQQVVVDSSKESK